MMEGGQIDRTGRRGNSLEVLGTAGSADVIRPPKCNMRRTKAPLYL